MAKRKDIQQDKSNPLAAASTDVPVITAPLLDPAMDAAAPMATEIATSDPAKIEPPKVEVQKTEAPKIEVPKIEVPKIEVQKTEAPAMPRAAVLPPKADAPGPAPADAAMAGPRFAASRFPLLAASVALAATLGAVAGSAGTAGIQQMFAPAPLAAAAPSPNEDVHALKETVAQLRLNVKSVSDNLAALRTAVTATGTATNAQFAKLAEAIDRSHNNDRHVATLTPSPEPTGSVPAAPPGGDLKSASKPPVVDGWVLRRVYNGSAALIEGRRFGLVEIGPGDSLPGIGRIQEIKHQDGHWVVVTARGLIMPLR